MSDLSSKRVRIARAYCRLRGCKNNSLRAFAAQISEDTQYSLSHATRCLNGQSHLNVHAIEQMTRSIGGPAQYLGLNVFLDPKAPKKERAAKKEKVAKKKKTSSSSKKAKKELPIRVLEGNSREGSKIIFPRTATISSIDVRGNILVIKAEGL